MGYDRSIISNDIDGREPNTSSIGVRVLDNLVQYPAHIRVYKDGEFIQSVYISRGYHDFQNLEYGMYRFEVIDPDYTTWWCDAFPAQDDYDNEIGNIELSSRINTVSYVINGDNPKTEGSGFDMPQSGVDWSNTEIDDKLVQPFRVIFGLFGVGF